MVYHMPCPAQHLLFVASSLKDEQQAETEILQWARANGYRPPQDDQTFVIYEDGAEARQWHLVERSGVPEVTRASGTAH